MTHFSWADGSIVGLYLFATMTVGIVVRKHVAKVEHFLVAGREMNVYLGIASLAATEFGIVTCMYTAQNGLHHSRRYALGADHRLPAICRHERRVDSGDRADSRQPRLGQAGEHRPDSLR